MEIRLKSNEVEVESEGMQCLHQDVHSSASVVQSNRTNLPVDIVRARSSPFRLQSYPTSRRGGALLHKEAIFLAALRVSEMLAFAFMNGNTRKAVAV